MVDTSVEFQEYEFRDDGKEFALVITFYFNGVRVVCHFDVAHKFTWHQYDEFATARRNDLTFKETTGGYTGIRRVGSLIEFRNDIDCNRMLLTIPDVDCGDLYTQLVEGRKALD